MPSNHDTQINWSPNSTPGLVPITSDNFRELVATAASTLPATPSVAFADKCAALQWTRRATLTHTMQAFANYILNLTNMTTSQPPRVYGVDETVDAQQLGAGLVYWSEVLAQAATAAPPGARGYHYLGRPDAEGYLAMAGVEMAMHTHDVLLGISEFRMDAPVIGQLVARLFPWAPKTGDRWEVLLWATGRAQIEGLPNNASGWAWHCNPMSEWNGDPPTILFTP